MAEFALLSSLVGWLTPANENDSVTTATAPMKRITFVFMTMQLEFNKVEDWDYFTFPISYVAPPFSVLGATSSSVHAVKDTALKKAIRRVKMIFFISEVFRFCFISVINCTQRSLGVQYFLW